MWLKFILLLLTLLVVVLAWYTQTVIPVGTGFAVKEICSGVFISKRSPAEVLRVDVAATNPLAPFVQVDVDRPRRVVKGVTIGFTSRAVFREGLGCTLEIDINEQELRHQNISRERLRYQTAAKPLPADKPWPFGTGRPQPQKTGITQLDKLAKVMDAALGKGQERGHSTRALAVAWKGHLLAERYANGFNEHMPLIGSGMGALVLNALIGILIRKGQLSLQDPVVNFLPAWQCLEAQDPQKLITVEHLLRMNSGLSFNERHTLFSDLTYLLYGCHDSATYAANRRMVSEPGTEWQLSSGSSTLLAYVIRAVVGDSLYVHFVRSELFNKIGMASAIIEVDPAGTFQVATHMFAKARDWLRLGQLYVNDGTWEGEQILPPGWVKSTTKPTESSSRWMYGGHIWTNAGQPGYPQTRPFHRLPTDSMFAFAQTGSTIVMVPSLELVIVRLAHDWQANVVDWQWDPTDVVTSLLPVLHV